MFGVIIEIGKRRLIAEQTGCNNNKKNNDEQIIKNDNTVNPLYNDIRYNSRIRYNVNFCTKISGSSFFSLIFPCYSSGKHTCTFCVFFRIASRR